MKYIFANGKIVTEEQLEAFYRAFSSTTFNEIDYKAYKFDKMAEGKLKFAE